MLHFISEIKEQIIKGPPITEPTGKYISAYEESIVDGMPPMSPGRRYNSTPSSLNTIANHNFNKNQFPNGNNKEIYDILNTLPDKVPSRPNKDSGSQKSSYFEVFFDLENSMGLAISPNYLCILLFFSAYCIHQSSMFFQ